MFDVLYGSRKISLSRSNFYSLTLLAFFDAYHRPRGHIQYPLSSLLYSFSFVPFPIVIVPTTRTFTRHSYTGTVSGPVFAHFHRDTSIIFLGIAGTWNAALYARSTIDNRYRVTSWPTYHETESYVLIFFYFLYKQRHIVAKHSYERTKASNRFLYTIFFVRSNQLAFLLDQCRNNSIDRIYKSFALKHIELHVTHSSSQTFFSEVVTDSLTA